MKEEYFYISNGKRKNIDAIYVLKDENGNDIISNKGCKVTSYTLEWAYHLKSVYRLEGKFKEIRVEKIEQ